MSHIFTLENPNNEAAWQEMDPSTASRAPCMVRGASVVGRDGGLLERGCTEVAVENHEKHNWIWYKWLKDPTKAVGDKHGYMVICSFTPEVWRRNWEPTLCLSFVGGFSCGYCVTAGLLISLCIQRWDCLLVCIWRDHQSHCHSSLYNLSHISYSFSGELATSRAPVM